MEDGNEDVLRQWGHWRETSLKKYQEACDKLNIKFDVYTSESSVSKESMDKALA